MTYLCEHEFILNGLWLHGVGADMQNGDFTLDISADGVEFGSAEAVLSVIESMWSDGSIVSQDRSDNDVTEFFVQVQSNSLKGLAEGEVAVRRAFPDHGETVDLLWRPGFDAPAAVRRVLAGNLGRPDTDNWDYDERDLIRIFPVTLTHEPFVRSEHETVVEALPAAEAPTTIEVDDFTSAPAGRWSIWSRTRPSTGAAYSVSGGVLTASMTITSPRPSVPWNVLRTGLFTPGDTPYLIVEHKVTGASNPTAPITLGLGYVVIPGRGSTWRPATRLRSSKTADGWVRSVFRVDGPTPNLLIGGEATYASPASTVSVQIRVLDASSSLEFPRAVPRAFTVGGTERTAGSLEIAARNGTTSLGTIVAHTCPDLGDGYTPDLMGLILSSGTETVDSNAPAGAWYDAPLIAGMATASIEPGSYMVAAWLRSTVSHTSTIAGVTLSTIEGASDLTGDQVTKEVAFVANVPQLVLCGVLDLPSRAARAGQTGVILTATAPPGEVVSVGGFWAFRVGRDCALSVGSTTQPFAWLNAATRTAPQSFQVAASDDRSQAWHLGPEIQFLASHDLRPGPVSTYVITTGVPDAAARYRYWKNWPYHPVEDGRTP